MDTFFYLLLTYSIIAIATFCVLLDRTEKQVPECLFLGFFWFIGLCHLIWVGYNQWMDRIMKENDHES